MRAVASILVAAAMAAAQCTQTFPNATFDLGKLKIPSGA